ncbi:MAG: hypothetical protein GEU83_04325 [Pseudonocardiaceae bacterium]|nr:hypothetical protein [Pseudonocardiaceae bacterium]
MAGLGYERYCTELVAEAASFAESVGDADPAQQVPTCPEWTLAQLGEHLGKAHRWVTTIVEWRATEPVALPEVAAPDGTVERAAWLRDGARDLAAALLDRWLERTRF